METLTQQGLDAFSSYLRKDKYKNKIIDLRLEHCTDIDGEYIHLFLIKIKRSQRNLGYGSAIMSDLIKIADSHNVRIILHVDKNLYGIDSKRLYAFYGKQGFVLIKNDNGKMIYYPKKIKP
jgi:ribosomal protein S18 acetylase RimI-like enzyme